MAVLKTLEEAEQVFNTYFYYGNNRTLDTITSAQVYTQEKNINWQKMASQLQFLAALYPRTVTYKTSVKNEISRILGIMSTASLFTTTKINQVNPLNEPGVSLTLLGLVQIKKDSTYTALSASDKSIVDSAITAHVNTIGPALNNLFTTHGAATAYKYKGQPVAPFALNIPLLACGAMGAYSDLGTNYSSPTDFTYRNLISNIAGSVLDKYALVDSAGKASIAIGGGNVLRKPFGSSGYNAFTGMGLSLAAHATVYTNSFAQIPNSRFKNDALKITAYYKNVVSNNPASELHKAANFSGALATSVDISEAKKTMLDNGVVDAKVEDNATGLSYTVGATAYLYNLAWTGDTAFLKELDAAVVRVGDAKKLTNVSAMRSCMNSGHTTTVQSAIAHRVLSGFAGCLERGITNITDGN